MNQRAGRVCRELRSMKRCRRKPPERLRKGFGSDAAGFAKNPTAEFFRQQRSAGNRGRASAAEKTHFHEAALINSCRQLENVAADGIARLNRRRGPGQLSRVSRIPKMIENGFAEHKDQNRSATHSPSAVNPHSVSDLQFQTGSKLSAILFL